MNQKPRSGGSWCPLSQTSPCSFDQVSLQEGWEWVKKSGKIWSAVINNNTNRTFCAFSVEAFFISRFSAYCCKNKRQTNAIWWMWHEASPLNSLAATKWCKSCDMATSDWSSTYTDRGSASRPASASLSPILVSTGSPPDSGNSSPNSPAFAQDVSHFELLSKSTRAILSLSVFRGNRGKCSFLILVEWLCTFSLSLLTLFSLHPY